MIAHIMDKIKMKLADRLAAKGLESNETELFIKDVIRIVTNSTGSNIETIKGQLHLSGWHEDYIDYGTIQLIQRVIRTKKCIKHFLNLESRLPD